MEPETQSTEAVVVKKPKARWRRWAFRLGLTIVLFTLLNTFCYGSFAVTVDVSPAPTFIHVFGRVYDREFGWCAGAKDMGTAPVSMATMVAALGPSAEPTIVHMSVVPLAWLGFADASTHVDTPPSIVFLQTGNDDYQPYEQAAGEPFQGMTLAGSDMSCLSLPSPR